MSSSAPRFSFMQDHPPPQQKQQRRAGAAPAAAVQMIHEVQTGETLASIAAAYKVSVRDLLTWNRLSSNVVNPGTRLLIYLQ